MSGARGPVTVVLGAGPAGLAAAWECAESGEEVHVVEIQPEIGGLAGSFEHGPFVLDYGPHKFYTRLPGILAKVQGLLGPELLEVPKRSAIWLRGRRLGYPFSPKDLLLNMSPLVGLRCGASYLAAAARGALAPATGPETYESWVLSRFGRAAYELVFQPYARKVWGEPSGLSADLARARIVLPSLGEVALRALFGDRGRPEISAKTFHYPRRGFRELWRGLRAAIERKGGTFHLRSKVSRLPVHNGRVARAEIASLDAGEPPRTLDTERVISSIPLTQLLGCLDPAPPERTLAAARCLRYRAAILLYLIVDRPRVLQDGWIFFPESRYFFNRIADHKAFSAGIGPDGRTAVCVDITCEEGDALWRESDEALFERAMAALEPTGLLRRGEVREFFSKRVPRVYPILDLRAQENLAEVWRHLDLTENLLSIGRHGFFQHNNSDHAMDMGILAARHLLGAGPRELWARRQADFAAYQIVD